jgi:hypothetical protein
MGNVIPKDDRDDRRIDRVDKDAQRHLVQKPDLRVANRRV